MRSIRGKKSLTLDISAAAVVNTIHCWEQHNLMFYYWLSDDCHGVALMSFVRNQSVYVCVCVCFYFRVVRLGQEY